MTRQAELIEQLMAQPDFPTIAEKIAELVKEEQKKRLQFYELVHEDHHAEFINGEIVFHSPVKRKHWKISAKLSSRLVDFVDKNQLGEVGIEKVMIRCTRNDYEPDICFFAKEKARHFTSDQLLFPPPDLAVEILSESTKKIDYEVKMADYAAHGVLEYWIIDPDQQSIEQYLLPENESDYILHTKLSGSIKSLAVKGFEVEVGEFLG
jgi:Uma2 family endonuclease